MTEQFPPGTEAPAVDEDGQYPAALVDGELLDAAPAIESQESGDDTDAVIEGEAIDLDELEVDAIAEVEVDAESEEEDDDDSAGSNGNALLVLDTWQIQIPATGDATVDAALARLTDVEGLPPSQHADVYEAVHAGLHEALADLDRS